MTFVEGMAALQLIAERHVGVPRRTAVQRENAAEDASMEALRAEQERQRRLDEG